MKPLVSVIIAAYNVERYITKAIDSALKQTFTDIEILVVDDGSSDSTVEKVHNFTDDRIRLYRNSKNFGPSFARNTAIREAQGSWIAILDADDWWKPERLEKMLAVAAAEKAEIVCDNMYLIEDSAEDPWTNYFESRRKVLGPITDISIITAAKMVSWDFGILQPIINLAFLRQRAIAYKEHRLFAEDFVLFLDCLLAGAKMVVCPEPYYYYRCRQGSITQSELASTQEQYQLFTELIMNTPYNTCPDVLRALGKARQRLVSYVERARVTNLFKSGKTLEGMSIVFTHPQLVIDYLRDIKHRVFV